jgi:nucleosome binding factor SPN SPT16 subunit
VFRLKNQKIPRLVEVMMRPHVSGRKTVGTLEAHENGVRFQSKKRETVDVLYDNIRNAIFQPCKRDLYVIIHFHLKDPIMINKKKHQDIQFFTEVVESVINMEGSRRHSHDPDEIDDEQREKELKKKMNRTFFDFCQKVQAVAQGNNHSLEFDSPFHDLAFSGTPHREMVDIHFTAHCICSVSVPPFFVVPIEDIEHVHFERIMPTSKNFDMAVILKDLTKDPLMITAIPRQFFLGLEKTLLQTDVTFTYGPQPLKWRVILDEVKGKERFYHATDGLGKQKEEGAGWEFLLVDNDESGDDDGDGDDNDSEFQVGLTCEEHGVLQLAIQGACVM